LEAMENGEASTTIVIATLICSLVGCAAVWALIRLFLRTEDRHCSGGL
jgi:hypothetical protein